jgi:hypothetical protein
VRSTGIGTLDASLQRPSAARERNGKPLQSQTLAFVADTLLRPGSHTVRLRLPIAARKPGRYILRIATTSPDGKRHATTTLTLEIVG